MNASGEAVRALCQKHDVDPSGLCVVVDEIALPLGTLRMRARGSAGGHNGLKSVIAHLGTTEFPRLRVGIRGERYSRERDLADYVLEPFAKAERELFEESVGAGRRGPPDLVDTRNRRRDAASESFTFLSGRPRPGLTSMRRNT